MFYRLSGFKIGIQKPKLYRYGVQNGIHVITNYIRKLNKYRQLTPRCKTVKDNSNEL